MRHTKLYLIRFFLLLLFSLSYQCVLAQDVPSQTEENSAEEVPAEADIVPSEIVADESRGVQTDSANPETVVELDEIENRQASTFSELLDSVPNVNLVNGATPQGTAINIRGLGSVGGLYGSDGKVGVVVDGVVSGSESIYRNSGLLSLEPELFREIKVNRGASGSFEYGPGFMGATIASELKEASDFLFDGDKFAFRQKFGFESNGFSRLTSSILATAPNDNINALFFYGYREVDDRVNGEGETIEYSRFKMPSYVAKINYSFNSQNKLTYCITQTSIPERNVPYNALTLSDGLSFVDRDTIDKTQYLAYNYNPISSDLVDFEVKFSLKSEVKDIFNSTYVNRRTGLPSDIFEGKHSTETSTLKICNNDYFETTNLISNSIIFGIEISKRTLEAKDNEGNNLGYTSGGEDKSYTFFITDEIDANNGIYLTPQLRFDQQKLISKNNNFIYVDRFGVSNPAIPDGTSYNQSSLTGGIDGRYQFNDTFSLTGGLFYNENLSGLNELRLDTVNTSEKGVTYEIGISCDNSEFAKSEENILKAKLNLFQIKIYDSKYTEYALPDVDSDGNDVENQCEKILLKGAELEISYETPNFYIDFNAGIVYGTAFTEDGHEVDYSQATAPSFQLTIGKYFLDKQLNLMVEPKRVMAQIRTDETEEINALYPSEPYTTFSVSSIYKPTEGFFRGFEFRASIENATDEAYRTYLSNRLALGRNLKFSISRTY